MRDDAVDILFGVRTVIVSLEQNDMRAGFASQVGAYLRFVGLFFQHRYRHEQPPERFDVHRRSDEHIRTSFLATIVKMALDGAFVVGARDEPYIFVVIPNHISEVYPS